MKSIAKKLEELDFSDKEARVYLALLTLGSASPSEVAQKSCIKRTTVYNLLPDLLQKGYITKNIVKGKTVFFVEDVRNLENAIEQKRIKFESLLPELQAMHTVFSNKPSVKYYEGEGGMREFYLNLLDKTKPGDQMYEFFGTIEFEHIFPQEFAEHYPKERARRKVSMKLIGPDVPYLRKWREKDKESLREMKLVPVENLAFSGNMQIYKNYVSFISYKENFMGVMINSKEMYQMHKSVFELLWKSLPESYGEYC